MSKFALMLLFLVVAMLPLFGQPSPTLLNATTIVLGFVFLFVDYCFIFREDQRCLHDLIAGTQVVRA